MPSLNKQNPNLDVQWFKTKLEEKQLTVRGLAKLLEINPSTVSLMLRGIRAIHNKDAVKLADILGVTTIEIFKRAGAPIEDEVRQVPVTMFLDERNELVQIDIEAADKFKAPYDTPSNSFALQIRNGRKHDGWMLVVGANKIRPEACLGSLVVYCGDNGITNIGIIKRGYTTGTYNVMNDVTSDLNGDVAQNMRVLWCQIVIWIKPTSIN
jgi:transcriptional regulator with XRE-family HTH domain